jgi:hypothetical protein
MGHAPRAIEKVGKVMTDRRFYFFSAIIGSAFFWMVRNTSAASRPNFVRLERFMITELVTKYSQSST